MTTIEEVTVDAQSFVQSVKFDNKQRFFVCNKCGLRKSEDDFDKDGRTLSGIKHRCKDCVKRYGAVAPHTRSTSNKMINARGLNRGGETKKESVSVVAGENKIVENHAASLPAQGAIVQTRAEVNKRNTINSAQRVLTVVGMVIEELSVEERRAMIGILNVLDGEQNAPE